jgi:predicted dehydrogenase
MLNAVIVGAGDWGQRLVRSIQGKSDHSRFGSVVARTPAKIADFASEYGLTVHGDYDGALADPTIDAVVLATPHSYHAEQVIAAAKAGKPVFVEKPFTLTKQSAELAVEACRSRGIVLAIGHNRRFLPAIQALKQLMEQGRIGKLLQVEGNFSAPSGYRFAMDAWRSSGAESPAGGMTALGIHLLDAIINLCGEIEDVHAHSRRNVLPIDVDDSTAILMRLTGGALGYLGTCFATAPSWRLQLYGAEGWIEMRGFDKLIITMRDGKTEEQNFPPCDLERAELEAFAAVIEGRGRYPVPAGEVVHGVAVLEAISRSIKTGQSVRVS